MNRSTANSDPSPRQDGRAVNAESKPSTKKELRSQISAAIDQLYAKIPRVEGCVKGCTDCCGPVPFSIVEAARAGPEDHRPDHNCIDCPHSKNGGCDIYKNRPLMCRLFAATEDPGLTCPHGARAKVLLTSEQSHALMDEYGAIMKLENGLIDTVEDELKSLREHRRRK